MSKWQCCVCGESEPCILDMVNDKEGFRPVCCPVDNTSGIKPDWLPVDEPTTNSSQLPKLTAEVFDRPDCPAWAKWAAVDISGIACFYDQKPKCDNMQMWLRGKNGERFMAIRSNKYDASDWQNSLIERSSKLPDWCKVGAYAWFDGSYFKITEIHLSDDWVGFKNIVTGVRGCYTPRYLSDHFKQARLRPWKGSESLNKVVITGGDTFGVVIGCTWSTANVSGQWINCKKLITDDYKQPDSSPCGVLGHLENGEWVK